MNARRRQLISIVKHKFMSCLDPTQQILEEKREIKRKCELLLKIYDEGRIEKMKDAISKYKVAARAALVEWIEYADEPKPDPALLIQNAGFDPEILDLLTAD
ncbi:unnamed protein product [Hymenolepis diminuta]|uniref:Uncharacterized protein n=2 Tax=Hymenolepis diminuta TaxID=6216 RepID=A0A564ZCC0_HYMDI|nr:unnamed protein product [Hymenolepis diminuta]